MATSQDIEKTVIADVIAVITAAGVTGSIVSEYVAKPDAATYTQVRCLNLRDILDGGTIPTGMRRADISTEAASYEDDDESGAILHALVAAVRAAIYDSGIVATLSAASTYNTYYGVQAGDDLPDVDGRHRVIAIQFSVIMKPEKV